MRFFKVFLLIYLIAPVIAIGQPKEPPLMYEFSYLCPSCDEEMLIYIRVASDETSIVETHTASSTPVIGPEYDDSDFLPGALISGPLTDGKIGIIQNWDGEIGTNFIEIRDKKLPEEGVRYVDDRLNKYSDDSESSSWKIDNVSVAVEIGEEDQLIQGYSSNHMIADIRFTETNYNSDGDQSSVSDMSYQYHLWFSEELPFSPLPFEYEPFKENRIPPYNLAPINDLIVSRLLENVEGQGGLVKSKIVFEGEEWPVEIKNVKQTPPPPMEKFETLPVISADQVDNFAGPLFIVSLLRDGELAQLGSGTIRYGDREIPATSAWKVNDAGDLVIVLSGKEDQSTFFLVRPLLGIPETGRYDAKNRPDNTELRAMGSDELLKHAGHFQVYGLMSESGFPTVVSGFESGTVQIDQSQDGIITGRSEGTVFALPTSDISETMSVSIELDFNSESGLQEFRFRSPESRYLER